MAKIIDGKKIAAETRKDIAERAARFTAEHGFAPGLAVIIVGEDPASQVYVRNKKKACEEVGFYSQVYEMPAETTMDELLGKIATLKNDTKIHGILVQLPLPKHLDEKAVIAAIPPEKDVATGSSSFDAKPSSIAHFIILSEQENPSLKYSTALINELLFT